MGVEPTQGTVKGPALDLKSRSGTGHNPPPIYHFHLKVFRRLRFSGDVTRRRARYVPIVSLFLSFVKPRFYSTSISGSGTSRPLIPYGEKGFGSACGGRGGLRCEMRLLPPCLGVAPAPDTPSPRPHPLVSPVRDRTRRALDGRRHWPGLARHSRLRAWPQTPL